MNINEWNSLVNWYIIHIEKYKVEMAFQQSLGCIPTSPNKEHVGSDMCIISFRALCAQLIWCENKNMQIYTIHMCIYGIKV